MLDHLRGRCRECRKSYSLLRSQLSKGFSHQSQDPSLMSLLGVEPKIRALTPNLVQPPNDRTAEKP